VQLYSIFHKAVRTIQVPQSSPGAARGIVDRVPDAIGRPEETILRQAHQSDQHAPPPF